jgi:UDP-glucose 4-epimerase
VAGESARVLVTGALGVNGVWTLRALLDRGADVLAVGRHPNFELAPDLEGVIPFRRVDVTRPEQVRAAIGEYRPIVIVHLAALMSGAAQADPFAGFEFNLGGVANVVRAAWDAGVPRVVYTSSKGVYGPVLGPHGHPTYEPLPEDAPLRPTTVYDYSKLAGEGLGENVMRQGGPEFASIRFATIYGPGKAARHGPMSIASQLVELPLSGRPVHVPQGGDQRDDYVYVRDVAEATALIALHPERLRHAVYNVGTGAARTLGELADAVRRHVPDAEIEIGAGLDPLGLGIPYYSAFDCSRIEAELGWRARFDFDAAVADWIAATRR